MMPAYHSAALPKGTPPTELKRRLAATELPVFTEAIEDRDLAQANTYYLRAWLQDRALTLSLWDVSALRYLRGIQP